MARLVGSRLAFPASTCLSAVVDEGARIPKRIPFGAFDVVFDARERKGLVHACEAWESRPEVRKALAEQQRSHAIRYSTLLQLAEFRRRHDLRAKDGHRVAQELGRLEGALPYSVKWLGTKVERDMASRLAASCAESLAEDFVFDQGIPYRRNALSRALILERWPERPSDPNKPLRACAFGGWLMAIATSSEDIKILLHRAAELTERRLRESP